MFKHKRFIYKYSKYKCDYFIETNFLCVGIIIFNNNVYFNNDKVRSHKKAHLCLYNNLLKIYFLQNVVNGKKDKQ